MAALSFDDINDTSAAPAAPAPANDVPPPPDNQYLPMFEHLENSEAAAAVWNRTHPKDQRTADTIVSPMGAVGRYQIEPATAQRYGLDPSRLTEPAYNRMAANMVLNDLSAQTGNDPIQMAIGYDSNPKHIAAWKAAKQNDAVLPKETQDYVKRARAWRAQYGDGNAMQFGDVANAQVGPLSFDDLVPGAKQQPTAPAKPTSSWWDVLVAKPIENFIPAVKQIGGSIEQMMGEHPGLGMGPEELQAQQMAASTMSPKDQQEQRQRSAEMTAQGAKIVQSANADIKANMPNVDPGSAKDYAYKISSGVVQMAPALAATAITRSPMIGAVLMGDQAFAQTYGQARSNGRTSDEAGMDAAFNGIVTGAMGSVKLGALMRPGGSFLAQTLKNAGSFGVISVLQEGLQIGYDRGLVNPNMTLAEAGQRLKDAGIIGTLQGAFLGAGHAGMERAISRFQSQPVPHREERQAPAAVTPDAPAARPQGNAELLAKIGMPTPGQAPTGDIETVPRPDTFRTNPANIANEHALEMARLDAEGARQVRSKLPAMPDETAADPRAPGIAHKPIAPDTAVTASGRQVPVNYALVEAHHLIPSQTPDGATNPAYPQELQPRDRSRLTSQAQIAHIARNINPRLLDQTYSAADGAPIIAPSGVVESGNGRTLAVQQAYAQNLPSAQAYREYLSAQGYPTENMTAPMLVRMRQGEMSPEDRMDFVREANQAGQMRYSATEQAMTDAARLPEGALDLFRGGDVGAAGNREFVRSFLQNAVPDTEHGQMIGPDGTLSQDAVRRVQAALFAKAYADPHLLSNVVESPDANIKAIGGALSDVAADWAKMRARAGEGRIPAGMDQTHKLLEAARLVATARSQGRNVIEFVKQPDIFTGQAIDPDVESWLHLMFRNKDFSGPVGRDKLADSLRYYAQTAQKVEGGPNLLGNKPLEPMEILNVAKERQSDAGRAARGLAETPSLPYGESFRPGGGPRGGSEGEGRANAPGGQAARAGGEGTPQAGRIVEGPFGSAPDATRIRFEVGQPGRATDLNSELGRYLTGAGVTRGARPENVLQKLASYVHSRGLATDAETLALHMGDGSVFALTTNNPATVQFGERASLHLLDPNARVVSIHNHPSSTSFSKSDIASLAMPGHEHMLVVGKEGNWHGARIAATLPEGYTIGVENALKAAYDAASDTVYKRLQPLVGGVDAITGKRDGLDPGVVYRIHAGLVSRALDRIGLIDYATSDETPAEHRHVLLEAAGAARLAIREHARSVQPADRSGEDIDRRAQPVRFGRGVGDFLGAAPERAGYAGSARSDGRGAALSQRPGFGRRTPVQLKLLEDENIYEHMRPPFYSALTRTLESAPMGKAQPKDWLGWLNNQKGVKAEELEHSGVREWLGEQKGAVTRNDVAQFARDNEVKLQEVEKGRPLGPQPGRDHYEDAWNWIQNKSGWPGETRAEAVQALDEAFGEQAGNQVQAIGNLESLGVPHKFTAPLAEWIGGEGRTHYGPGSGQGAPMPGGKNYRELLLTTPKPSWMYPGKRDAPSAEAAASVFQSPHWDEPNVLAHIRFDDRTGPNGEKVLHIAEVQSDWHQKGRVHGYHDPVARAAAAAEYNRALDRMRMLTPAINSVLTRNDMLGFDGLSHARSHLATERGQWDVSSDDQGVIDKWYEANKAAQEAHSGRNPDGVPNAPFKQSWHELAMKRMLRYAAENGYDKLSWDTGDTNAARYDLSKQVGRIRYDTATHTLDAFEPGVRGGLLLHRVVEPDRLADTIGKEAADKIVNRPTSKDPANDAVHHLYGVDLKVGGEGMKAFYDKILPQFMSKYVKKWGAKVADEKLGAPEARVVEDKGKYFVDAGRLDVSQPFDTRTEAEAALSKREAGAPVHSVAITPAMRKSLLEGQGMFEDDNRYKTEPGAVDARGKALPQTILPGMEGSATELAKAREAAGKGKKTTNVAQKEPGGLFGPPKVDHPSLFDEDSNPYSAAPMSGGAWNRRMKDAASGAMDVVHDFQMLVSPMAHGEASGEARAKVKDFANVMRLARDHGQQMMKRLKADFDHTQLRKMWEAADEESVARQQGKNPEQGTGLSRLTPEERQAVRGQQADAQAAWNAARDVGMVKGDSLPSYVPRMLVDIGATGAPRRIGREESAARSVPGLGRNIHTSTPNLLRRKYLTTAETEAAGSARFGTQAEVVKDIRTLPLATMRLRDAVAGRELINHIKEIGARSGETTVSEETQPEAGKHTWFTMEHPAFKTWRPAFRKNADTGQWENPKYPDGSPVFEKVPIYVRSDYEGPLRAIMSEPSGAFYKGMMALKGKVMNNIMFSPLVQLHLLTELGRAFPAAPLKVATLKILFEGNRAKQDQETRTEAIRAGLVPIGHQGAMQDITSMAQSDNIIPGRSWTAKMLGAVPGWVDPRAGQAVYRAIDKLGDVLHNTLLWDRVQDLQFGLYTTMRDHWIKNGQMSEQSAQRLAAHEANRYAGALPMESMSNLARKWANAVLFSRTYTMGNWGVMKDALWNGLPRDVAAQIERDQGLGEMKKVRSLAKRSALGLLATDIGLIYASNSVLMSAFAYFSGRQSKDQIFKGYWDRLIHLGEVAKNNPLAVVNPIEDMQRLSATSENEIDPATGKPLQRILIGYDKQGTAQYVRNPVGKYGEEIANYSEAPGYTALSKLSPFVRPIYDTLANKKDTFGHQLITAKDSTAQAASKIAEHFMEAQVPMDQIRSAYDLATGHTRSLDLAKLAGRSLGLTFRSGYPGGPAVGLAHQVEQEHRNAISEAMPGIHQQFLSGDRVGAMRAMMQLKMPARERMSIFRSWANPSAAAARAVQRYGTASERERFQTLKPSSGPLKFDDLKGQQ